MSEINENAINIPVEKTEQGDYILEVQNLKKYFPIEKDLFGNKGGYITQLSKNSLHEPCMKCGHEIHKANYMGGTVYFCEHCQRR